MEPGEFAVGTAAGGILEWLKWHQRHGHVSFNRVQFLMKTGVHAKSQHAKNLHARIAKLTTPPKCAACQYAKARH